MAFVREIQHLRRNLQSLQGREELKSFAHVEPIIVLAVNNQRGRFEFGRVPIDQGLQLFTALQRQGIESRLLYYPDEGHWILKLKNSQLYYQTVFDWLDRFLKPGS